MAIHRIAMETAADVIPHTAHRHRAQRLQDDVARQRCAGAGVLAEQEQQLGGARELRRIAETPSAPVEGLLELPTRLIEGAGVGASPATLASREHRQPVHDPSRRADDMFALLAPGPANLREDVPEPRTSKLIGRREIGAPVERPQFRRQPDAHRPATGAGRGLHERHVDAIDIGTLLTIHLHRDEIAVEEHRRRGILERLVLHHVAPVARGVADGQKDRARAPARLGECRLAPGPPVHWIVGMLQEVWALLGCQAVRHLTI